MSNKWEVYEEYVLLELARTYYSEMVAYSCITVDSPFMERLLADFRTQTCSDNRDALALLFRLKESKLLVFHGGFVRGGGPAQAFRCAVSDERCLYDFTVCPPLISRALGKEIETQIVDDFSVLVIQYGDVEAAVTQLAIEQGLIVSQIVKVLFSRKQIVLDPYLKYVSPATAVGGGLQFYHQVRKKMASEEAILKIRDCQSAASQLYAVHDRDGAEVLFSSDGTGFGKSYGVIQRYIDYLTRYMDEARASSGLCAGFTNLVFITPQKSQIDLCLEHIEKIMELGGEFLCILARSDITNLAFVNWATKETNDERYKRWYEGGKGSQYIGKQLRKLNYCRIELARARSMLAEVKRSGGEGMDDKEMLERRVKGLEASLAGSILDACEVLVTKPGTEVADYLRKGRRARVKRLHEDKVTGEQSKLRVDEVYLEVIKQVLPFEICQHEPSVMLLTTNKFDTTTKRLQPKKRGEGYRLVDMPFDHVIGGKQRPEELKISLYTGQPHTEQMDYLRDTHFALDPSCPFRAKGIRFTLIIDELHESYQRLADSCHTKLVSKENNLAHVFSVVGRIVADVDNLKERTVDSADYTHFEAESVKFVGKLRELLDKHCVLSSDTTLDSFLRMFSNQLGAFEVNSDEAERIIGITRNIFSFNAKMFVNEEALKQIRLRKPRNNVTRTELYYEVVGENDDNPTLHDLFQVVSVMLGACATITDRDYKRWIKCGGQELADSQNSPLGAFIDAANKVSGEIRHIFERKSDANQPIDHFYTYLQPKTVFSLTPVNELNYRNRGAERTVILAFEMEVVRELPEAMLLRLLSRTHNKVICLSATSGFTNTKNGNFSRAFLARYADDLGYKLIARTADDIGMLQDLRRFRAELRQVDFTVFDAEQRQLTNTMQRDSAFSKVYRDILSKLRDELGSVLNNPYKDRQVRRELEGLLLAAHERKNTLILALSGEFKRAFISAFRHNLTEWRREYGMRSHCDGQDERHDKILEFTPFCDGQTLRLVFFDSELAKTTDVREKTEITDTNTTLVFMSTYNSAGTGLNYYVRYLADKVEGDSAALALEVDFQRLILVNSSFYSEVKNGGNTFNTLHNLISLLKHFADDDEVHLLRDLGINFADGENLRVLMAEHAMSLFKVIVQAIGRVERRDSRLHTEIFLPSDIMDNVAFQFANLGAAPENTSVLEAMSLLNNCLREHSQLRVQAGSFVSDSERTTFENTVLMDGQRIDAVFKRVLKADFINRVRRGDLAYLPTCNLFRDPLSFSNPQAWLSVLRSDPHVIANPHLLRVLDSLFIPRVHNGQPIRLCHKRGADGLPVKNRFALSDFAGGASCYEPERAIFPQYSNLITGGQGIVSQIIQQFTHVQETVFTEWAPAPALIPLLKGNVGEAMFDMLLRHHGVNALSDIQVFERLEPLVYEFFDRFIEVEDGLICVDVKNWSTRLDNLQRAEDTLQKGQRKMQQISHLEQKMPSEGQHLVQEVAGQRYAWIKFVYLNTAYAQNPNNLMSSDNAAQSVHYLNLFQEAHQYQDADIARKRRDIAAHQYTDGTVRSRLNCELVVNPSISSLLAF